MRKNTTIFLVDNHFVEKNIACYEKTDLYDSDACLY